MLSSIASEHGRSLHLVELDLGTGMKRFEGLEGYLMGIVYPDRLEERISSSPAGMTTFRSDL